MKAVLCKQDGPPASLVVESVPSPQPGKGQVVVSVRACGVNFPDTLIIAGKYQYKPDLPFSPGSEMAGLVKQVGEGVSGVKPGDAVSVRLKEARDWHRIGLNYVYLEPANARVLRSDRFAEASAGTQLIQLMYPIHFGRFGGRWGSGAFYAVMVAYVLLGLAPVVLMVTGSLMYWNRSWSKKWRRRGKRTPDGP